MYRPPNEPQPLAPRRLELSLNPEDGSLLAVPLLSVLMASTDGLYADLYDMAHGEVKITSAAQPPAGDDPDDENNNGNSAANPAPDVSNTVTSTEKMNNLSFAQRRHELVRRMARHGYGLTHVAALTAAHATTDFANATRISTKALQHARTEWVQADEAQDALYFFHAQLFVARRSPHDIYGAQDIMVKNNRKQSDGSNDNEIDSFTGMWHDMPTDLKLVVDRYENSHERRWSPSMVADRWHTAVRDKLLRGEVGWRQRQLLRRRKRQQQQQQRKEQNGDVSMGTNSITTPFWKISLQGGIVRLSYGKPKYVSIVAGGGKVTTTQNEVGKDDGTSSVDISTDQDNTSSKKKPSDVSANTLVYPIEAIVTVLSTAEKAEWTLVSVEAHAQARTGESNHQLDTTNRQRYDLHRLSALAMAKEEARYRNMEKENVEKQEGDDTKGKDTIRNMQSVMETDANLDDESDCPVARPLRCLFQVAHIFSLSWQLEILSAQAQALRKGVWSTAGGPSPLVVTPVQFYDDQPSTPSGKSAKGKNSDNNSNRVLGMVSISFWNVDDRYGPPCMNDLSLDEKGEINTTGEGAGHAPSVHHDDQSSVVSGRRNVSALQQGSVSSQLTLSVRAETNVGIRVSLSGAATIMEFAHVQPHTRSTIQALIAATSDPFALSASGALLAASRLCAERRCHAVVAALQPSDDKPRTLPPWITLSVERGSIAVAAQVSYYKGEGSSESSGKPVILFRLTCDARTGSFVCTFSRSTQMLQLLTCNDLKATESTTLRVANLASHRRRGAGAIAATGRAVREAFDGLSRSMNVLGQRCGVGGAWNDHDDRSVLLRQRAIQVASTDVRVSLVTCCGMAALYGLSAVAIGVATGVAASADMAGDNLPNLDGIQLLSMPPLSLLLDQRLVEEFSVTSDGEKKKQAHAEQTLFGISCAATDAALTLYPSDLKVVLATPVSAPTRTSCTMRYFVSSESIAIDESAAPATKRAKLDGPSSSERDSVPLMEEVEHFASILSNTLEL